MASVTHHHIAVRVSDIPRSVRFYEEALGARVLMDAFTVEGELAEMVLGGPTGVSMKIQPLALGQGAIELYEFVEPVTPTGPMHATQSLLLHVAVRVDDIGEALRRVEQAGGTRAWPEMLTMSDDLHVIYVHDPDGNVLELIDGSMERLIELTKASFS